MFSFLDQNLFDSDTPVGERSQLASHGTAAVGASSAFSSRDIENSADGQHRSYGGSGPKPPPAQQTVAPTGPIECHDADALGAMEAMIRTQVASEKRLASMENRLVGLLEHVASAQQKSAKGSDTKGLSSTTLFWVLLAGVVVLVVFGYWQKRNFSSSSGLPSYSANMGGGSGAVVMMRSLPQQGGSLENALGATQNNIPVLMQASPALSGAPATFF